MALARTELRARATPVHPRAGSLGWRERLRQVMSYPAVPASVLSKTITESEFTPSAARRSALPLPVSAARTPASDAAPLGPDEMPAAARSAAARRAASSVTATAASSPLERYGQAIEEIVPQLSPAMTVLAVGIVTGIPARRLASRHAAVSGSTDRTAAAEGEGCLGAEFCPRPGHPSPARPPRPPAER